MARAKAPQWQHPFVDVFKTFGTDASSTSLPRSSLAADVQGDVSEEMDREICKRVFRIRGAVSSNNYIQIPSSKGDVKSLALTGEYIYLLIKPLNMNFFLIHLDFIVSGGNRFRVTLSNVYPEVKTTYHSVQLPCQIPDQWSVVRVHVPSALAIAQVPAHAFALKSLQICASLYVRNVFTSDRCYHGNDTAPREFVGEFASGSARWYDWAWIQMPDASEELEASSLRIPAQPLPATRTLAASVQEESAAQEESSQPLSRSFQDPWPKPITRISRLLGVSRKERRIGKQGQEKLEVPRRFAVFVRCEEDGDRVQLPEEEASADQPRNVGDDTEASSVLRTRKLGGNQVVSVASMALTLVDIQEPAVASQKYFFAHSRPIELLEASDDGRWVASVQGADSQGSSCGPPLIRLWRARDPEGLVCASILPCPTLSSIRAVAFDPGARYLAVAGQDLQGRQNLIVWDMSRAYGGGLTFVAKQSSSEWDLDCLRFSPFEELNLVTCGKENIRFWRVKESHMPGRSVVLKSLARQSHFTAMAFEFNRMGHSYFLGESLAEHLRMFVGTADGKVLQLSYRDRKVQAVYQLHTEAITWMCANEGFVVTASADRYVRVWPLDFKSFYLHAIHESPVVGVDITADGMQVLCSTADGSIGVLDMQSHLHQPVLRSHNAPIADGAISEHFKELATVCCDGTLKVWSVPSLSLTYEFSIEEDEPKAVAFHPGSRHLIACGYQSGTLRIFDADAPALLCERRHHVQPIASLVFVTVPGPATDDPQVEETQIITCDTSGALAVFSEARDFQVVRCPDGQLCAASPDHSASLVCAPPRLLQYLDSRSAALLALPDAEPVAKLRVPAGSTVASISFSARGRYAVIGTSDSRLHVFEALSGRPSFNCSLACGPLSSVLLAEPRAESLPILLVMATEDKLLRFSQLPPPRESGRKATEGEEATDAENEQSFLGHAAAPHRLLLLEGHVLTISSSEVMSWALAQPLLENLEAEGPPQEKQEQRTEGDGPEDALQEFEEVVEEVAEVPSQEQEAFPEPPAADTIEPEVAESPEPRESLQQERGQPDSSKDVEVPVEEKVQAPSEPELLLRGLAGCSLHGKQMMSWQASPFRLCHIVSGDVYVEDYKPPDSSRSGPERSASLLTMPGPDHNVHQAVDLDPSGRPLLGSLSVSSDAQKLLTVWDLQREAAAGVQRSSDLMLSQRLPEAYTEVSSPLLRMLPGGRGAITATAGDAKKQALHGRVDVWRFSGQSVELWASAEFESMPLDVVLLGDDGQEFAVLSAEGLVLWRCSFEASSGDLQFQIAEAPASWDDRAGHLTSICAAKACPGDEEHQLLLIGSAGGALWVHDADDNTPLMQLQISASASSSASVPRGLSCVASAGWPMMVAGVENTLQVFDVAKVAAGNGDDEASSVLIVDGAVKEICLQQGEQHGLATTSANTLWYFHFSDGLLAPLRSFHEAPSYGLASSDSASRKEIATCGDDGSIRLWRSGSEAGELVCSARLLGRQADGPCVAVCFPHQKLLACAFLGGSVMIFCRENLGAISRVEICKSSQMGKAGELLLTMEAVGTALLVGTSHGRVVELPLQASGSCEAELILHPGGAMICDMGSLDQAQLAFSASMSGELRVWKRGSPGRGKRSVVSSSSSSAYPSKAAPVSLGGKAADAASLQLLRKVTWPGPTLPQSDSRRCSREECQDMLKTPTLTACLVPCHRHGGAVLAISAYSASSLFLYSFADDTVILRVELSPSLLPVLRLRSLPAQESQGEVDSLLLILGAHRFSIAQLYGRACGLQISEEQQVPGSSEGASARGRPDALLSKAAGHYQAWIKSEAAISSWDVAF
eukprot:CAMPEP_0197643076 /NCGR_PEP_ID=MMETSP1338-20131121/16530_1 /TAXON_ID=43686 ORGANISM="Pelagodinium beii, Strain RCC1491" /NCGR_SAMPLE_ID=MMETSP1338 /ASSEMBLY_ACC=CAM_ASM_000754 /LENGTH=1835 /DNA_ID=CAMNT_0043216291 /DNA_START=42 /DNA_END=5549 /DNA_ORIENTATION=-